MTRKIEGEKYLEKKLRDKVKTELGGKCLKLSVPEDNGMPDRLCLFPGGRVMFAEIKKTGKKPRKLQLLRHRELRALGFRVDVVDCSDDIEKIIKDYDTD